MAMEISVQNQNQNRLRAGSGGVWKKVMELTKLAQNQSTDPGAWAIQLSSILSSATVALPSAELAHLLVSHICWANHLPIAWKFLEKALAFKIVPPMLVLSLLSAKVIPFRHLHPLGYRLYMEFLKAYAFSLSVLVGGTNCPKIMKSIDDTLHLSQIYGLQLSEPGLLLVEFTISIAWQLLDASLDDEGLLVLAPEESSRWSIKLQDVEMDGEDCISEMGSEQREELSKMNTAMAIKIIGEFLQNQKTARILSLARQNMQMHWASFICRLQLLTANSTILKNSKLINPEVLLHLASDTKKVLSVGKVKLRREFHAVMAYGSLFSPAGQSLGASCSAFWLPIDMFLEDAMDGSRVAVISAVERLTGLVKALKVVNETSWHNTFLGLWIAALRLVQRERDPSEGPVSRLDTCLCMLLSITTLAITHIVEEEEGELIKEAEVNQNAGKQDQVVGQRRKELVTSLQLLGDYEGLVIPPQSVSLMANQSAAKAIAHISGYVGGTRNDNGFSGNDMPMNCSGNMWHLIVEACIARNLLDTSAYFWPGYVNVSSNQTPCGVSGQVAGWSSVMKGCALTPAIVNVLVATPASSLAEIETIYEIALNGSDDEKIHAAKILCGASLVRSWNIQEHIILFLTRLLSPSVPGDYPGSESYLIKCAPFLNVLLVGISSVDCLQIFSLHGLAPLLAGQLMPICEAFGSCTPNVSCTLHTEKELSFHVVFSNAFTLLLRLWRFDHLPIENCRGDMSPIGYQRSPEYLLSVRNSQLASFGNSPRDQLIIKRLSKLLHFHLDPIFLDSFPKLKSWYRQHQECNASTLSGLLPGSPCHQIVDALLGIMFRKTNKSGQSLGATTTGSSNSSESSIDDTSIKLRMPGWDILEATPFALDAALTACAHGRLSPRELATGLKDLADFLPASLATIVSYFSAEVTRGIWKPASMNGTDWPSPAANLSSVEQQIKKILDATGVDVPSLTVGNISPATLPLPLAALISLTITYKLDKESERLLTLTGPAVNSLSAGCPWPCMPIIVSLWAQKVKRWSDFLVFSASRTVFYHNSDAVVQLLKSCFTSTLGTNTVSIDSNGGVGALLGHGFGSQCSGGMAPVAPGILYLRVHRYVRDMLFITEKIVSLLMLSVRDIVKNGCHKEKAEMVKRIKRERHYGQVSLSAAMTRVKLAASLGSSLVWISGGSNLVHSLLKETLPAWFLSRQVEDDSGELGGVIPILRGYALAYFTILCGSFAWGVDSTSPASKRREKILGTYLKFLTSALDEKISLGCDWTTWQAYVTCFVSLMVSCTPQWVLDVNVDVLKRLSRGLRLWNEEELALALLEKGGVNAVSAAAQLIIESRF